ncbi:PAS domain-containing protein [Chryseolinea sp. T2]|uniref:PAS domain-containing sensor histidine kinase n=1 Tax=Chryseolinea sp. T2 TaxID=3129255 RepID=UPI00307815E2
MVTTTGKVKHHFLEGGGEMGALTRSFDWSKTPLGAVDQWPQTLKAIVGVILHSEFPMFLWWGEEMIQFYNDAYRPSLGENGKHPAALGQHAAECWPEIWDVIYPLIKQVRTTNKSFFLEDQLIPIYRNGSLEEVYWTFSYSSVIGETGTIDGVLVVCNETTSKVKTLQELERNKKLLLARESNLLSIIRQAPVAMCILMGPHHVVEIANDKMFELWGKPREEFMGKPVFDVLIDARYEGFEDLLKNVYRTGKTYSAYGAPVTLFRNGGTATAFVHFVYEAFREADGTILGVMVVASNVTEEMIVRKQLEDSEHQVRSIIESAPFPIGIYVGREMRIIMMNQAIIDVWGKGPDQVGKTYYEALPELESQDIFPILDRVFMTGEPFHARNQRVDLVVDGKLGTYYFNYSFTPLFDRAGNVYGVMNTAADVTDLNQAKLQIVKEQELARQKIEEVVAERTRDLQKSNAELSQFAYIASHDLQEPARKISTFIGMINKSLEDKVDPRTKTYLEKIEVSAARMLALIRDVLSISQLSKINHQLESVSLSKIVQEVSNEFELMIELKQAIIESDPLPEILAIPVQMSQLFGNLISNALKFAKPDVPVRIRISAEKFTRAQLGFDPDLKEASIYYRISIADNGIGFSQSNASQIFDIFQRLHSKSEFEGTGIGLAMCRKIVENHGGRISASGELGIGARFTMILPAI